MRRIVFIISLLLMGIGILITGCGTSKLPTVRSSDGVQIAYHTVGEGNPALVFVHGWSCDKSYWKEQVPFFSEKYRVVTIDLAGHGDSGADRTDWSIPAFGQDVASVIKALNLKRVILESFPSKLTSISKPLHGWTENLTVQLRRLEI